MRRRREPPRPTVIIKRDTTPKFEGRQTVLQRNEFLTVDGPAKFVLINPSYQNNSNRVLVGVVAPETTKIKTNEE